MPKTFNLPSGRKLTVSVESAPDGADVDSTETEEPEKEEE